MTKDELLKVLKSRVGSRNDSDVDEMLLLELELAQADDLEANGRATPWFLYSERATIETAAGEERVKLPNDFLREVEEGTLSIWNPELEKFEALKRDDYDTLSAKFKYAQDGRPQAYALEGQYFRLFPRPDANYTIGMRYVMMDTKVSLVSSDKENLWMKWAPNLLICVAGRRYASLHLVNPGMAAVFEGEETKSWDRLVTRTEARRHTNRTYVMGGED